MNSIFLPLQFQNISFIFLSISFSVVGFLYAFHKKYAKSLVLSAFGQRYANQYLRDDNVFKRRVNILFSILMILNISLFIWGFKLLEQTGLGEKARIEQETAESQQAVLNKSPLGIYIG